MPFATEGNWNAHWETALLFISGYGDWYPDTWMSRLFVVILICTAIGILPSQVWLLYISSITSLHKLWRNTDNLRQATEVGKIQVTVLSSFQIFMIRRWEAKHWNRCKWTNGKVWKAGWCDMRFLNTIRASQPALPILEDYEKISALMICVRWNQPVVQHFKLPFIFASQTILF